MAITLDRSTAPLMIVTATGDITVEDIERYHGELDAVFRSDAKIAMVVTVVALGKLDRKILKVQSEWFKRNQAIAERQWLGIVFHFGTPLARFFLSSFLLFGSFPMPYAVKESEEAARAWARDVLTKGGVSLRS
jgi:hypothetical protein